MSGRVHTIGALRARPVSANPQGAAPIACAAAGLLASILLVINFGFGARALVAVALAGSLAALAAADIERRELPNRIVVPAICTVLALQLVLFPDQAIEWIGAAAATGLVFLWAALSKRDALGSGDVKLGVLLGAGLGTKVVPCLVVAIVAMWPFAAYMCLRHGRAARTMALPLAPFLAVGAVVALLAS